MNGVGRCQDCRWWGKGEGDQFWVSDRRHPPDYRHCELTVWVGYADYGGRTRAYAVDADDFSAVLLTAPTHGCVQFEAREAS